MVDGKPWTSERDAEYEGGHKRAFWGTRRVSTYGVNRVNRYELVSTDHVYIYTLSETSDPNGIRVYDLVQHLKRMFDDYNRDPQRFGNLFEGLYGASLDRVIAEYLNSLHQGQMVWLPLAFADESNAPLIPVVPLGNASVTVDDNGLLTISWSVPELVVEGTSSSTASSAFAADTQITLNFSAKGELQQVSGTLANGLVTNLLLGISDEAPEDGDNLEAATNPESHKPDDIKGNILPNKGGENPERDGEL